MRPFVLALLLSLLTALPAGAASKLEKIHELVEITEVSRQMETALDSLWPLIVERGKQANPTMPPEMWDRVRVIGREEFDQSLPDVLAQFEKMYDANFTEPEIDALLTFYKSPIGNGVMHKLNAMAPQTAALGQAWGAQVSKQVIARLAEETRSHGYDLHL